MTNLSGGWEGRKMNLLKAESGMLKRMLLVNRWYGKQGDSGLQGIDYLGWGMAYARME